MTAKSKAFQAMAIITVAAITYSLSNSSSESVDTKANPVKEQMMAPVIVTAKSPKKQKQETTSTTVSNQSNVPGYSNPDEFIR